MLIIEATPEKEQSATFVGSIFHRVLVWGIIATELAMIPGTVGPVVDH